MRDLQARLLITLAYSAVFQFPLNLQEIAGRLVFAQASDTTAKVLKALERLKERGIVAESTGSWTLATQRAAFVKRRERDTISQQKWQEVAAAVALLQQAPGLVGVAVTGSVAVNNALENSDIDFMLVTAPGWLWLTRLWVIWQSWRIGKRRSFAHEEANSWCFNLWLSSDDMALPLGKRSLYGAYEVCQAEWVWQNGLIKESFLKSNSWVRQFVPHLYVQELAELGKLEQITSQNFKVSWVGCLNWLAYQLQLLYMMPHMTREIVNLRQAFFHPRATEQAILNRCRQLIRNLTDTIGI